jgi:hypothetical protein
MGVKRVVHDKVGGFDESLREREDTDDCFRIQLEGIMLHFAADATIHIRYSEKPEALFHQARRWARYQVLLYKRYGGGMPLDRPWSSYLQIWRDLIGCMPRVFKPETRPAWMKTVGTQIGLLEGAIRYRVPPVCAMKRSESASEAGALPIPPLLEQVFDGQLEWTSTGVNLRNQNIRQELQAKNAPTETKQSGTRGQKLLLLFVGLSSNVGALPTLL